MASLPASPAVVNDDDDDDDDDGGGGHHSSSNINADPRPTPRGDADGDDMDDPQRDLSMVRDAIRKGCGCHLNCFSTIPEAKILDNILTMREMVKETKEAYILSKMIPIESASRCSEKSRSRKRCYLYNASQKICKTAFETIFDIKKGTRKRMQSHLCERGIEPRVHGLTGRRPSNAFSHDVIKKAVHFLINYAVEEGLPQPAPLRGRPGLAPIYLPVNKTKRGIHGDYVACCKPLGEKFVGLSTFKDIWSRCVPHIKIKGPKDDVCKKCEDCIEQISLARSEDDKLERTSEYHAHVLAARTEREEYKRCVAESSAVSTAETRFVICKTPLLEMDAENIPRVIPPAGLSD